MKMKAAIYYGARDIRVEEIERPRAEDGVDGRGLVLKVKDCGICGHKDLYRYQHTQNPPGNIGIALGDQYVGEVVEIGPKVTGIKVGDRMYGYTCQPCFECEPCRARDYAHCVNRLSGGTGNFINGGQAEYILWPYVTEEMVHKLPDDISYRDGALSEPLMLGIGVANKARAGDVAVLLGLDMTNLCALARLKEIGAAKIIASDIGQKRLKAARELGADVVVDFLEDDLVKVVMKETAAMGANTVIVTDAKPILIQYAMSVVGLDGAIWTAIEWLPPFEYRPIPRHIPHTMYQRVHYTIRCPWGTLGYPGQLRFDKGMEYIRSGKITAKKHVTHVFPLDKIKEAYETALNPHESIKVMVEP
jgi:threonine dehydrogenase-like Zn-dependent dehydrogenase